MHIGVRLIPLGLFLTLIGWKVFDPTFLAVRVWDPIPVTWWWVAFFAIGWVMAWAITPPFHALVTTISKHAFLPLAFFIVIFIGLVWFVDEAYNLLIASWCGSCGHSNLLDTLTKSVFGGR